ncbi:MAG: DNA polymerase III subunit beta [Ruminococcaceae bacterium]|nr:DNA polymerase III subunit beta [Oscillospiraceae bacterium]
MKIIFNRQQIGNAVAPLMCAVSGKSTLTAIEGILIDAAADGTCTMTTFDLEKGMRIQVQAEVEEPGCYILNAQKFSQTVRVMEGDQVTLTVSENLQACISSGKSSHRMNALAASDYPTTPRLTTEDGFIISQAALKEMLSKTMYAMASNDQRPVLNGCYFRVTADQMLAVSCDSFKLARCAATVAIENKNEDGSELNFSFIIPNKTVNELYRLLKDDERETVRIYMTRKNIVFHFKDTVFFSRLIDGVYIEFDRIILKNHRISVVTNRETLISALERAALVTEEKVAGSVRAHVRLELDNGLLKISANSALGSTYDEIAVEQEGDGMVIAFNNRFLIDSLRACSAENIRISMTSALTSINITPADDCVKDGSDELFMLLPVRMKD